MECGKRGVVETKVYFSVMSIHLLFIFNLKLISRFQNAKVSKNTDTDIKKKQCQAYNIK